MPRRLLPVALAAAALLAGCTLPANRPASADSYEVEAADPEKLKQIKADNIRALLDNGQYYAALAHVQDELRAAPAKPELLFLEAEARRNLKQTAQAEALYRRLIDGPMAGRAWHGLGLLKAGSDLPAAIAAMRKAAAALPTDVEIRNDLGYALMEAGRYGEALPELSTAAELAPGSRRSRNNLILLMLLTGNTASADTMAAQAGTPPEVMRKLREQARSIRSAQTSRSAPKPG